MQTKRCFVESLDGLKVDRKRGIIHGVKILGLVSENGRRYLPSAVKDAIKLYENCKVNIDHPDKPSDTRSAADRIGKLVNVHYVEGKGLFGDFEVNAGHPFAEQLFYAAEHMPDIYGMSHNAQGDGEEIDGVFIVNKIVEVRSVDLVADPATTRALNESKKKQIMENAFKPEADQIRRELDKAKNSLEAAADTADDLIRQTENHSSRAGRSYGTQLANLIDTALHAVEKAPPILNGIASLKESKLNAHEAKDTISGRENTGKKMSLDQWKQLIKTKFSKYGQIVFQGEKIGPKSTIVAYSRKLGNDMTVGHYWREEGEGSWLESKVNAQEAVDPTDYFVQKIVPKLKQLKAMVQSLLQKPYSANYNFSDAHKAEDLAREISRMPKGSKTKSYLAEIQACIREYSSTYYDDDKPEIKWLKDAMRKIDQAIQKPLDANESKEQIMDDELKNDENKPAMEADNPEFKTKAAEIIGGDGQTEEKVAALVELVQSMYGNMEEAEEPEMDYNDGEPDEGSVSDEIETPTKEEDAVHVDIGSHGGENEEEPELEAEDEDERKPMEAKESRKFIAKICRSKGVALTEQLVQDLASLNREAIRRQISRLALAAKAKRPRTVTGAAIAESKLPAGDDLFRWLQS